MKKLNELQNRKNELGGSVVLELIAGSTVSEMLLAETQRIKKEDFLAKRQELAREGKYCVLVAEPERETMEQAIVNFCKEQARENRQREFNHEVSELQDIKLEIKAIERLENDPKIIRIKRILKSVAKEDKEYIKSTLVNGLTDFSREEKAYICQNIL